MSSTGVVELVFATAIILTLIKPSFSIFLFNFQQGSQPPPSQNEDLRGGNGNLYVKTNRSPTAWTSLPENDMASSTDAFGGRRRGYSSAFPQPFSFLCGGATV